MIKDMIHLSDNHFDYLYLKMKSVSLQYSYIYEQEAEKVILVDLLERNITGLLENEVMIVGNYRNDSEISDG